jgi:mono/diheme cytochrome c family protein
LSAVIRHRRFTLYLAPFVAALAVVLIVMQVAATTAGGALSPTALKGKALFLSTGCGKCHTLKAAGSTGQIGPDLDTLHPTLAVILHQINSGGAFMPSFGTLPKTTISRIAAFVYAAIH